jgi:flavin reductase (DIM6/NTAB) family NADH-FMN oxidoreductase RutF
MNVSADQFKAGMRRLAASVCVITTLNADGSRNGLTATAVCSMSADPAMLLCCLNKSSNTFQAVTKAKLFAVNVLGSHDHAVAQRFSSSVAGDEKFAVGDWGVAETGAPMLNTAPSAFDCRLMDIFEAGTHGVLFGQILAIHLSNDPGKPLLYGGGAYGAFTLHEALAAVGKA